MTKKSEWCSFFGIAFDGAGSWSFGNDFAKNVENSSPSLANNHKNNFLVVGEGPTYSINRIFGSPERKSLALILVKQTHFTLSVHYDVDNTCLSVNGKEIFMFKVNNKTVSFPTQFCLRSISN